MVSCINIIRLHNFCSSSAGFPAPPPSSINDTPAHQTTEKPSQQLGFAYTTPCLVTGWWKWTWNWQLFESIRKKMFSLRILFLLLHNYISVPCESGYMYDCNTGECQQCPHGSYQPQWGQTSCWPCPGDQARIDFIVSEICFQQTQQLINPEHQVWTCARVILVHSTPKKELESWRAQTIQDSSRWVKTMLKIAWLSWVRDAYSFFHPRH